MPIEKNIVKNASKAYGYNYASLADIVNAGYKIPKMRIKPTSDGDYIEYKDDAGEWQIGAKIVVPDMKGSNDAQAYGAALTYARRYTALLALSLVCDDDKKIETNDRATAEYNEAKKATRPSFDDIRKHLATLNTTTEVNAYAKEVAKSYPNPTEKMKYVIETMFSTRREEIVSKSRTV